MFNPLAMPGRSHQGPLSPLTPEDVVLRDELEQDIRHLAGAIGERNMEQYASFTRAADWIEQELAAAGFRPARQPLEAAGRPCHNIEARVPGEAMPEEAVVIGAHYDTVRGSPGADDNASGVAALLALARRFNRRPGRRGVRFVAFANEEMPYFGTASMGSWAYAAACRRRNDRIAGMLSLESIGYYSDRPRSQTYPFPFGAFYPSTGNFIGIVGHVTARRFIRGVVERFRSTTPFPCEGAALPGAVPGIEWSDNWAFRQCGYPAAMVTDTVPFRNPHYHAASDTPETIDVGRLARVVAGLQRVVEALVANPTGR